MAKNITAAFKFGPELDVEAAQVFAKALQQSDTATFTYIELRIAVRKLLERGMSPADAFTSVFVTAETLGRDRHALLESTEAYLATLEREKDKMQAAMQARLSEGLAAENAAIEALRQNRAEIESQIRKLQDQMRKTEEKEQQQLAALEQVEVRVKAQGEKLMQAYEAYRREISADLAAMRSA